MYLYEKEINIPVKNRHEDLLGYFKGNVLREIKGNEIPVRFVVTGTDDNYYHCELGLIAGDDVPNIGRDSMFAFNKRAFENTDKFNVALIVPTGIGAEIGGHSGDAGPVARLMASTCDTLITHPNVVNASDINELPENGLYVEGSVLTRLLMGTIGLQKVRANRVLLVVDKHEDKFFYESAINAASAARAAMGLNCPATVLMEDKITMRSLYSSSGRAVGRIDNFERICSVLHEYRDEYDSVALSSVIRVPEHFHEEYYTKDILNPWGGVEAMLTHALATMFNIPVAHSPMLETKTILDLDIGVTDPRKAAEIISVTFLHSVFKGMHRSPKIISSPDLGDNSGLITATDISCIVVPVGCLGLPVLASLEQGIPVIAVKENANRMQNNLKELPFRDDKLIYAENYLEAAGIMNALRNGVSIESLRRPLEDTKAIDTRFKGFTSRDLENMAPSAISNFKKRFFA